MPLIYNEEKAKWDHKCGCCEAMNPLGWTTSTAKNEDGSYVEWCDECSKGSHAVVYDVYWDGKPEENLADGPDGKPRVFLSKGQKARYLRERGLSEAGDRVHGAPFTSIYKEDPADRKRRNVHSVSEARRKVEQMGKDVRRQAILKVVHDARNYA